MSGYKWLSFAVGIPIAAVLIALVYEFARPAITVMKDYSTSQASAEGIAMYESIIDWLPFIVVFLLAVMLIVAIITRRRRVGV